KRGREAVAATGGGAVPDPATGFCLRECSRRVFHPWNKVAGAVRLPVRPEDFDRASGFSVRAPAIRRKCNPTSKRRSFVMRPIRLWVLAVGLLPSTIFAALLPDAGQVGEGPAPIPRSGDRAVAYVVVTDRQLQGAFMPLVQARTRGGLRAAVVTLDAIEHGYPGG